jgi:hypothetical protein
MYIIYILKNNNTKKKPIKHFLVFKGPLNLCFVLLQSPHTILNGFITLGILSRSNALWYSIIVRKIKMKMIILIENVITNGNIHLHTFQKPKIVKIHLAIFNFH